MGNGRWGDIVICAMPGRNSDSNKAAAAPPPGRMAVQHNWYECSAGDAGAIARLAEPHVVGTVHAGRQ